MCAYAQSTALVAIKQTESHSACLMEPLCCGRHPGHPTLRPINDTYELLMTLQTVLSCVGIDGKQGLPAIVTFFFTWACRPADRD